jgi:hypothetical protein
MRLIDNRIIVDLNKVQFAKFYYGNQHGQSSDLLPKTPTVFSQTFDGNSMHASGKCTMMEYAQHFRLLDVWVPYVYLQLSANHKLVYSGPKAQSIYKEWNKRIFNKRNK